MSHNLVETLMGAVVLIVAAFFLTFAYSSTNVRTVHGYEVTAKFDRVDGLNPGSDVKISGIKVGTVVDETLDPETFLAIVKLSLKSDVKLPTDTVAQVSSEGLLGGNFLALVPSPEKPWVAPFEPNHTGTPEAYVPPGHDFRGGHRAKATGDYEPWVPS